MTACELWVTLAENTARKKGICDGRADFGSRAGLAVEAGPRRPLGPRRADPPLVRPARGPDAPHDARLRPRPPLGRYRRRLAGIGSPSLPGPGRNHPADSARLLPPGRLPGPPRSH